MQVSRREIKAHIDNTLHIGHLQLDSFIQHEGDTAVIRIQGRGGIDKTFKTTKAAKAWVTRISNKCLEDQVNRQLGLGKYAS